MLLLALFILTALLPASAFTEEAVVFYDSGTEANELVRLRFTGISEEALQYVTLFMPGGVPLTPEIDAYGAPAYGSYLLPPGVYFYSFHDPYGRFEDVPETSVILDGTFPEVETALPFAASVIGQSTAETAAETEEIAVEPETAAMPVMFRCDGTEDLSTLTVVSVDGTVMQPYVDPDSGAVQYGNYLLPPGAYYYRLYDPMGRFEDAEDSFTVYANGVQVITISVPGTAEGMCFSDTFINPSYSGLIDASEIPTPSVSPEESLDHLLHEVEGMSSVDGDMNAVYYAAADGTGASESREPRYSPVVYNSLEEAGAAVKRGLLRREKDISIRIRCDIYPSDEAWRNASFMIYSAAIAHTGEPTEGDYLRYEYGGVNCTGSAAGKGETGPYYYEFNYAPLYFTSFAQEMALNERVVNIISELNVTGMRDEQKISAVYQYLCDHVSYEEGNSADSTISFTAYGALINGKASCQGIAVAFYRLCLKIGVDARVVTCTERGHAWNIARADGKNYYALDATWDIGTTPETRQFYLKGRTNWLKAHTLGDEFINGSFSFYSFPDEDYEESEILNGETTATIQSVALVFDGMLRIKYYFIMPDELMLDAGAKVQFSRDGVVLGTTPLSEAKSEGGKLIFYCGVEVIRIDDPIMLRILDGSGKNVVIRNEKNDNYLNGFSFSPMQYAQYMKDNGSTPKMCALAKALEDYGVAAKAYFNNSGESVSNEVRAVTADQLSKWTAAAEGTKPGGFAEAKISCLCEADNSLRVYFFFDEAANPANYSYRIDNSPAALQLKSDGNCYLEVKNIAANALDTTHLFTISDGTNSYTMKCSVLSYAKMAIEHQGGSGAISDLGRALYLYNRAADEYFGT